MLFFSPIALCLLIQLFSFPFNVRFSFGGGGGLNLFPAIIGFLLLKKHLHVNELGTSAKNADSVVYYFF